MFGSVNLLFDKSAFESLTHEEHSLAGTFFRMNVTPVLVNEIIADLEKEFRGARPAEERVAILASKFFGSGEAVSLAHRRVIQGDLFGNTVPMTGRIIPENASEAMDEDREISVFIDLADANFAIMRLASQQATEEDRWFAKEWRIRSATLSFERFDRFLADQKVILSKASTPAELAKSVDRVLDERDLQRSWLRWWLALIQDPSDRMFIKDRWRAVGGSLRTFAPYSYYCLRALLLLWGANRFGLIRKWKPTNLIDVQYLYYLPFCMVFVSGDTLHKVIAPLMCRPDQRFVSAEQFKAGLKEIAEHLAVLPEAQRRPRTPPKLNNAVTDAWEAADTAWRISGPTSGFP